MAEHLIPIRSTLELEIADRICVEALRLRRANGLLPLTIAVLDAGGHLVSFRREDGCGVLRAEIGRAHV